MSEFEARSIRNLPEPHRTQLCKIFLHLAQLSDKALALCEEFGCDCIDLTGNSSVIHIDRDYGESEFEELYEGEVGDNSNSADM